MKTTAKLSSLVAVIVCVAVAQVSNKRITYNDQPQLETSIAVSPTNPDLLIASWNDYRNPPIEGYASQPGFSLSFNGGKNWTAESILPYYTVNNKTGFDPSVGFDGLGNVYYAHIRRAPRLGPVVVAKSTDMGDFWSYQLVTDNNANDKPNLCIDQTNNRIYLAWVDFSGGSWIKFAYSDNQGSSFYGPFPINLVPLPPGEGAYFDGNQSSELESPFVQCPLISASNDNTVYLMWIFVNTNDYSSSKIRLTEIHPNGDQTSWDGVNEVATFSFDPAVRDIYGIAMLPSFGVNRSSGTIHIVYPHSVGGHNTRLKYLSGSYAALRAGTVTPVDFQNIGGLSQGIPSISVDENGRVSVLFSHMYSQPSGRKMDRYFVESYDDGASFTNAYLVTDYSGSLDGTFLTDYDGLASVAGGNNFVLWTDTRAGNRDIFFHG